MKSAQEFGLSPAGRSKIKDVKQQALPFGDDWNDV